MTQDEGKCCPVQPNPEHNHETSDTDTCYVATAAQPVVHDDDPAGGGFPLPDGYQGRAAAQCVHLDMAKILKTHVKEPVPVNPLGLALIILEV